MNTATAATYVYETDKHGQADPLLLLLFYVWTFILAARPQDALSFLEPLRPVLLTGTLTFICLLAVYLRGGIRISFAGRQPMLYALFVAVLALSVPFGYYPGASAASFLKYLSAVLFFVSFIAIVDSVDRILKLLKIFCVGMLFYGVYSLLSGNAVAGRLTAGTMYDPNDLGYFLISLLTFNFLFLSAANHWLLRSVCMANLLIAPVTVLMTGSRGGFVALAIVVIMLIFGKAMTIRPSYRAFFITVLLVGAVSAGSAIEFSRLGTLLHPTRDYNYTEETGRLQVWKRGAGYMLENPVFGVGMDRFSEAIGRDRAKSRQPGRWQTAHNSWIQVGAEAGLIAFVLFGLLNLSAYRSFNRVRREGASEDLRKIGEMARIGFVGNFVCAMFLSQAYAIYWVFYLALSVVLPRLGLEIEQNRQPGGTGAVG